MSERGVFAVDRGIWDHPLLASADPFSRREAWLWLLSEAAWKPRRVRVAGIWVELNRGQLSHSLRHMADQWGWSVKRVRTFLTSLQADGMLSTDATTGITVVTICNYDKYQKVSLPNGTPEDTGRAQEGHAEGTITKAFNTGNNSVANATGADAPPAAPPNETPEARLWRIGPVDLVALGVREQQARKLIGAWRRDTGDDCERVLGAIMRAREYAVAEPIAWITASLKSSRQHGKTQTVQSAAAELVADLRKLNERPPGIRGGAGTTPFRLLSTG